MAERVIDNLITVFGFRTDRAQLERTRRNIDSVRRGLDGFARGVGIAGAAAGAALAAVGRASLEFERAQNRIAAVYLDQTREQLEPLREQARELGALTSRSATEAANAQVELARAGFKLNEVLAATPNVLDLAIAGELEMAEAALLLTSQLNAFGFEAADAGRVTDVLAATASSSATSVAQLGPALRQVAPLAAAAGMSLEEVGAAIGLLRDSGLQAEAAGTALRGMLARLSDPNPPTSLIDGLAELGLTAHEVQSALAVDGLVGVMRLMRVSGLDAASAIQIFGVEAASAAVALAARAGDLADFEAQLRDVEGAAERMRDRMGTGLPGATAEFGSALQELMLALGDAGVAGQMLRLLSIGTDFLRWLSSLPGPIRTVGSGLAATSVALLTLGALLKVASFALGGYAALAGVAAAASGAWGATLLGLRLQLAALAIQTWLATAAQKAYALVAAAAAVKTGILAAATWALNAALFANPITWIALGVMALIAALVLLVIHWDTVRDAVVRALDVALDALRKVWSWIRQNWPLLAAMLGGPFTLIPYLIWRFRDTIMDVLSGLWDWIRGWGERIFGWVDNLVDRVRGVASALKFWERDGDDRDGGALNAIGSAFGSLIPGFAAGGLVPGPRGQETLARVHGGEAVLPSGLTDMLRDVVRSGVSIAPPAVPALAASGGLSGGTTRVVEATVQLDNISISVERGDPDEIAAQVGRSLQDQLQDAAEDFASRIVG